MSQNIVVDASVEDALLAPILAGIPGGFFSAGRHARAVYLPVAGQDYSGLVDRHAFSSLAAQARSLQVVFVDADGWPISVAISNAQIPRMISGGMTICAMGLPKAGSMGRFLNACSAAAPDAGEFHCDAFLSPHGSGFAMHLDPRPTLILQIAGRQRCRFVSEPESLDVLVGIALPPGCNTLELPWGSMQRPEADRVEEVTLEPGDALYLPTGCWYEGHSSEESFALSISIASLPPLAAFKKAIAEGVESVSPCVPAGGGKAIVGKESPQARDSFRIITAGMSAEDLRAAWCDLLAQASG